MADAPQTLDLAILDASPLPAALAYARCGSDIAVARLPFGKESSQLRDFRSLIERALRGKQSRPTRAELTAFGHDLFGFCVQGDLVHLFNRLPSNHDVRIHIMSNHPEMRAMPWEYLQEPHQNPGPRLDRSVARIVPIVGQVPPPPVKLANEVRVLFVASEPVDQEPVPWPEEQEEIETTFRSRLDVIGRFEFKAIEGATRQSLLDAVAQEQPDIFHFSGHGEVVNGVGQLILTDRSTRKSTRLPSDRLSEILGGRGIRLAVLSACDTASGDFADDFSVVAEALVRAGIPAVVANQLPVPNKSVAIFVAALYQQLLQSGDIDRAVGEGRIRLSNELEVSDEAVLEWGIPTVYRHVATAQIFVP